MYPLGSRQKTELKRHELRLVIVIEEGKIMSKTELLTTAAASTHNVPTAFSVLS